MLAFILALITIFLASAIISPLLHLLLIPIEVAIQTGKKSPDGRYKLGAGTPGERLPYISFLFGLINYTVAKTSAFFIAQRVFDSFEQEISLFFVLLCGLIFIIHDLGRINGFLGTSGVWKETGYFLGDLTSVVLAIIFLL